MQVVRLVVAIVGFIAFVQTKGCDADGRVSTNEVLADSRPLAISTPKSFDFKVATIDCFAERSCLAFVSVGKKHRDEEDLADLSGFLSDKNKDKKSLVIYFFEDFTTAKSFAEGKVPPRDLDYYAIGAYRYDEKEEYLKIRKVDRKEANLLETRPEWRTVFRRTQ